VQGWAGAGNCIAAPHDRGTLIAGEQQKSEVLSSSRGAVLLPGYSTRCPAERRCVWRSGPAPHGCQCRRKAPLNADESRTACRGQAAKIVGNSFFPNCETRPPTATAVPSATATPPVPRIGGGGTAPVLLNIHCAHPERNWVAERDENSR